MKLYLAGSCAKRHRPLMRKVAKLLREKKFDVYCPFELKIEDAWDYTQENWSQLVFEADKAAMDNADIFFMISPGRISTAGTNWEQGYAYANKKLILVFQYTKRKTSLMTYCTADEFVNSDTKNLLDDITKTIKHIKTDKNTGKLYYNKKKNLCKTILT